MLGLYRPSTVVAVTHTYLLAAGKLGRPWRKDRWRPRGLDSGTDRVCKTRGTAGTPENDSRLEIEVFRSRNSGAGCSPIP